LPGTENGEEAWQREVLYLFHSCPARPYIEMTMAADGFEVVLLGDELM
jgi:hypothetical protein